MIYLEGSGCYGMNGHEDAAADAAILSRATGRPVRVQWTREDECSSTFNSDALRLRWQAAQILRGLV